MENTITGSCLCGKVRYEVRGPLNIFQYCHCSRCRKFTGSAHSAHIFVPPSQFRWIGGEEQIGRFELPEAKYFATAFCKNCGSSLPWAVKGGKNIVVTAGTLDDDPGLKPRCNVYWGSRAEWFDDTGKLEKFEEIPRKK